MRSLKVLALGSVSALLLTACGNAQTPEAEETFEAPEPQLQTFYDQRVEWRSCASNQDVLRVTEERAKERRFKCATVRVPLDYADPAGPTIDLEMVQYSTSRNNKPLVYNPGGPGGSAISSLPSMVDWIFSEDLLGEYSIVAVDPRGVGLSAPVECLTPEEIDEARALTSEVTIETVRKESKELGEKCLQKSPDMTKHSDSMSAARDLDIVRAAMGQESLDYLGFSYGTFLGALYADTFPGNVGRFVLDGAMDPAATVDEVSELQAKGFEDAAEHWLDQAVASGSVPLTGSGAEAKLQLRDWLESLEDRPLPTADPNRPLTRALATSSIVSLLYDTESYGLASAALTQAMQQQDGSMLLQIADLYADRQADGTYLTNTFDAFNAVNSLDYKADGVEQDWIKRSDTLKADLPLMGSDFGFASAMIEAWPVESRDNRKPVKAEGAPPILVVGVTHDPATPYVWAEALADQLESGHLLTVDGWEHCGYSRSAGDCVVQAVDNFLIDGELPEGGLTCQLD
ncbi:MAG TPA: alpha/beta hydrolase [Actinomyces sp.]|nr:alpha/beta hydrolase [Acidobacteriota bacterium]HHT41702.1 alpha/beta hydrolase [Actinomyces sp.]